MSRSLPILTSGSKVRLIAPASACARKDLSAGIKVLRRWRLTVSAPENLFQGKGFLANDDATRGQHLHDALTATDTEVIWCVRGGYGSLRLLAGLDRIEPPAQKKLLLGFSDITVLQHYVVQKWGWPVLHTPVVCQLGDQDRNYRDVDELRRILFGLQDAWQFNRLKPMNTPARRAGRVLRLPLLGGNLKSLQTLPGTPWSPEYPAHILFLEDVDERGYAIDRMLTQLRAAGFFNNTRALVLGEFAGGREPNGRFLGHGVLREFARDSEFPVYSGLPAGHGRRFRPLPLGLPAQLIGGDSGTLSVSA